jgi:hypothetical protein
MGFTGELRTFDIFDLLAWAHGRRKSGSLRLTRRSTKKTIALRDGAVQFSGSNDPRETTGQALVREGLISEEALFKALLRQETDKRRLGEILMGEGLLTEEQLMRTLRMNAEAHLYDLFLWPDGHFDFKDDEVPPETSSDLGLDLRAVLEEGRQRRERWVLLRDRFPSSEVTFRAVMTPSEAADPVRGQVHVLAAKGGTLGAISLETRRPEYETALLLAGLIDEGLLEVDKIRPGATESDPVGMIQTLLEGAAMRLKEGRFDMAFEAYERVLMLDGVNQAAKKGLLAVGEARQRAKAAQSVPLDKVPVLRVAAVTLAQQQFDPQEGFVLSRVNGEWDVRSILKLCPLPEEETLLIFGRLLDRQVIALQ